MKFSVLSSPTLDVLCFFLKSTKKKKILFHSMCNHSSNESPNSIGYSTSQKGPALLGF